MCSILNAPHPIPPPPIPISTCIRSRLDCPLPSRVSHRFSTAAAAVAPVSEEEDESAEVNVQVQENSPPVAVVGPEALQDDSLPNGAVRGYEASPQKLSRISLLPPEVLARIEKKAAQYDEEQAIKGQARKERKVAREDRKKQRKSQESMDGERMVGENEVAASNGKSVVAEEAFVKEGETGKRSGKKERWTDELKGAVRTLKEKSKAAVAEGKDEWPKAKQRAITKEIKDWIRDAQVKKRALVNSHAPQDAVSAIERAINEAVVHGRIPKDGRLSRAHHNDSVSSKEQQKDRRPTGKRKEGSSNTSTFSSPFFSPPTHTSTDAFHFPSAPASKPPSRSAASGLANRSTHPPPPDSPSWKLQRHALQTKFAETGWSPRRKLSPDAQRGIRDLHASNPELYSTPVLAETFKISPEAIRRILRSKWMDKIAGATGTGEGDGGSGGGDALDAAGLEGGIGQAGGKMQELRERWARRYDKIWDQKSELGLLPKRSRKRRVESGEKGRRRVEEGLWRDEVLDVARREEKGMA